MARHLTIICSSSVPPGIRGALTQWLLEVLPGIFLGTITTRVRNELWNTLVEALQESPNAYAVLVHHATNEQGYTLHQTGNHAYQVEDFMGLQLITRQHKQAPARLFTDLPDPTW